MKLPNLVQIMDKCLWNLFHQKWPIGYIKFNLSFLSLPFLFLLSSHCLSSLQRHHFTMLQLGCVISYSWWTLDSLSKSSLLIVPSYFFLKFCFFVTFLVFHLLSSLLHITYKLLRSGWLLLALVSPCLFQVCISTWRGMWEVPTLLGLESWVDLLIFQIKITSESGLGLRLMECERFRNGRLMALFLAL